MSAQARSMRLATSAITRTRSSMRRIDTERAKNIATRPTIPVRFYYKSLHGVSIDCCPEDERSIANKLADAGKVIFLVAIPETYVDFLSSIRMRKSRRARRHRN